jgi:xanthine dehydrogenase accessory factor
VVVEVVEARGSVPREAGTRMLVGAHEVVGTIGGGHLELQAIGQAREALGRVSAGASAPWTQSVALGPSLGQCCGGALSLRFTLLAQVDVTAWPLPPSRFHLQLHGAGHVGRAIVRLLADLPCTVTWVDEREGEFPSGPLPAHVERRCTDAPEAEVASAPAGSFFLVLTHRHDLDLRITEVILQRPDFGFFGLIGSRTKAMRFRHRLEARGLPQAVIDRMTCPIGLPGLTGKAPEVIAVSVVAQLLLASSTEAVQSSARTTEGVANSRPTTARA